MQILILFCIFMFKLKKIAREMYVYFRKGKYLISFHEKAERLPASGRVPACYVFGVVLTDDPTLGTG